MQHTDATVAAAYDLFTPLFMTVFWTIFKVSFVGFSVVGEIVVRMAQNEIP